jgi:hypothetical protein
MTPTQISELFDKNALYTINSILGAKKLMDKSTFLRLVEEIRREDDIKVNEWLNNFRGVL